MADSAGPKGRARFKKGSILFRLGLTLLVLASLTAPALAEPNGDNLVPHAAPATTTAPAMPAPGFSGDLTHALEIPGLPQTLAGLGLDPASLDGFYKSRPAALWVDDQGLTGNGHALLNALWQAATAGCHNIDAAVAHAQALSEASGTTERTELELTLTGALAEAAFSAVAPFESVTKAELLDRIDADNVGGSAALMLAREPNYWALVGAFWKYLDLANAGGWPTVPAGPKLEQGMKDPRVSALRARLAVTDGAVLDVAEPDLFDPQLVEAVEAFQRRHGLGDDGVVGFKSVDALNVPIASRLQTIAYNLEKRHDAATDWGDRYIVVNIAAATMVFVDGGQIAYETNTVVGRPDRQTPELDSQVNRLEFNPYWTVPPKIARVDLLPKLQKDPGYLAAHGIKIYSSWEEPAEEIDPDTIDWHSAEAKAKRYRLRQDPGPENALGPVKFLFPNPYDVYLHGTNHPDLFVKPARFFSSGCIRLPRPIEFASVVLRDDPSWDQARIDSVLQSGINTPIRLAQPIPVHLVYRTAWVDGAGAVQFREDVYRRDKQAMAKTPTVTVSHAAK
jgi:murein L,D-transpeptidase YcbB/YkuD